MSNTQDISGEKASDLVMLVAHQLRTPVSSLRWYTELLLGGDAGPLTEEQKKYLEKMLTLNQNMRELLDSFLDFARLEQGAFAMKKEAVLLTALVEKNLAELAPALEQKGHTIRKEYSAKVLTSLTDPTWASIVIHNLLSNAIKYTPEKGTITVTIAETDSQVLVHVADTGYGIPADAQQKIFSKAYRGENVKSIEGTGFGLYMVKKIVEALGGTISFSSVENKGTTFSVALPGR